MPRALVPVLLALCLLVPAYAAADGDDERDGRDGPRNPTAEQRRAEAAERAGEREEQAADRDDEKEEKKRGKGARDTPAIGEFQVDPTAREVRGDFVNFSYDGATVRGYTVRDTKLFDATVTETRADHRRVDTVARGAEIRVETPAFRLRAHDNPSVTTLISTPGLVTLTFVEDARFTQVNDRLARFAVGNVSGFVRGEDLEVEGRNLTAESVMLVVDEPRGRFDKHREAITAAIERTHVGAELSLVGRDDGEVEHDSVSYGNVTLTTVKAERGNFTVLIDGHGFEGRVLVFNLDGRLLGASHEDELTLRFDNETMRRADSIQDVLDPDDDGLAPEYYVVFDPQADAFQLLVSVPHYSVHVLSVGTLVQQIPPSVALGVVLGVALLAPAGYVLFRRR